MGTIPAVSLTSSTWTPNLSTGPETAWARAVGKGACLGQRGPETQLLLCAEPGAPITNTDHWLSNCSVQLPGQALGICLQ